MPLAHFALVNVAVIAAAFLTVLLGALIMTAVQLPIGFLATIPVPLVAYVLVRMIADRLGYEGGNP